jgi:hypothetical protein
MPEYLTLSLLLAYFVAVSILSSYCARYYFEATFRFLLYHYFIGSETAGYIVGACGDGCPTISSRTKCALCVTSYIVGMVMFVYLPGPRIRSTLLPVIRELEGVFYLLLLCEAAT